MMMMMMVSCWVDDDGDDDHDDGDDDDNDGDATIYALFISFHPSLLYHQISNAKAYHIPLSEAVIDADGLLAEIERLFIDTL